METGNAIELKHVTKSFKVFLDKGKTLKEKALFLSRRKYEVRKVLDDISFEVKKGEAIGLIGHNGCGKSTTLKLLTRIMYPDTGTIEMKGRVSSLIELGAGFHPDMSGRQNIYTNASIFGLTRREIDARLDDIIAFSELEAYIDNPVRTYSSGMYMRLAFSVAINVDADILLIDEILAVGDTSFQEKCFNKLREIKASGTTIVIVSHSLGQIEQMCERSIWIHEGNVRADGRPRDVHPQYLDYMGQRQQEVFLRDEARRSEEARKSRNELLTNFQEKLDQDSSIVLDVKEIDSKLAEAVMEENQEADENRDEIKSEEVRSSTEVVERGGRKSRWGNGFAVIQNVILLDKNGDKKLTFKTGEELRIRIDYLLKRKVVNAVFGIGIFRIDGIQCYGTNTRIEHFEEFNLVKNGQLEILLNEIELLPGEYSLDVAVESGNGIPVDYYTRACRFQVYSTVADIGISRIRHEWKLYDVEYLH